MAEPLERKPSVTYGHHRQTSLVRGVPQHSRNGSLVASPTPSSISPPMAAGIAHNGHGAESASLQAQHIDTSDLRSLDSASSTANGSISGYSAISTLLGDRDTTDTSNMLTQRKVDRMHSGKTRRDHSHQRSHSKPQHHPEQRSVGEYALHHLFNSVSRMHPFRQVPRLMPYSSLLDKRTLKSTNVWLIYQCRNHELKTYADRVSIQSLIN